MHEGAQIEFDQDFPTLEQMRPSLYGWRRDVIPANPLSRQGISVTSDWVKLPSGESTIKGDRCVDGNPDRRIILQSSAK